MLFTEWCSGFRLFILPSIAHTVIDTTLIEEMTFKTLSKALGRWEVFAAYATGCLAVCISAWTKVIFVMVVTHVVSVAFGVIFTWGLFLSLSR